MNDKTRNSESIPNAAVTLGELLNQARIKKSMSIGEVAECLKLPARQIEAIESGSYDGMPEAVFIKGFLTSYARLLELDEKEFKQYLYQIFPSKKSQYCYENSAVQEDNLNFQHKPIRRHFPRWVIGLTIIIIIGGGIYAWQTKSSFESAKQAASTSQEFSNQAAIVSDVGANNIRIVPMSASDRAGSTEEITSIANSSSDIRVNAATSAVNSVASEQTLMIKLEHRTWLQVINKDNKVLISEVVEGGTNKQFQGGAPYKVVIGYTPGAIILFDGKNIIIPQNKKRTAAMTIGEN